MGDIIAFRADSGAYFEASLLEATIGGMNSLIEQHQRLEAGESFSDTSIRRDAALIQGLVDDYIQWRGLDKAADEKRKDAAAAAKAASAKAATGSPANTPAPPR
jgi:hypothetical protein